MKRRGDVESLIDGERDFVELQPQPSGRRFVDVKHAAIGYAAYNVLPLTTDFELENPALLEYRDGHSGAHKFMKGTSLVLLPVVSWLYAFFRTSNVPSGHIGVSLNNGRPEFLAQGWHFLGSPLRFLEKIVPLNSETPIINLTKGIITVRDGHDGLAQDKGKYVLLGPGMHQWESDTFSWISSIDLSTGNVIRLGPFTPVTVPPGEVAVTENNGSLIILDVNRETEQRTHFLNHAKWQFKGMLSKQVQIDSLVSSNLLTADRVEVNLDSTISWHIVDPHASALTGGHTMEQIREVVHRAARAGLSDMIAERNISDKTMGRMADRTAHQGVPAAYVQPPEQGNSQHATLHQLEILNEGLKKIGVELTQIAIVQLSIHHEDTRREIAKIAAIPAKTKEMREVAEASAENRVVAAKGEAAAVIAIAEANARSVILVAEAQKNAGAMLGAVDTTASTLAQIDATGKALSQSKSTVFFIPPGQTRSIMSNQSLVKLDQ